MTKYATQEEYEVLWWVVALTILFVLITSNVQKRKGLIYLRKGVRDFFRGKLGLKVFQDENGTRAIL